MPRARAGVNKGSRHASTRVIQTMGKQIIALVNSKDDEHKAGRKPRLLMQLKLLVERNRPLLLHVRRYVPCMNAGHCRLCTWATSLTRAASLHVRFSSCIGVQLVKCLSGNDREVQALCNETNRSKAWAWLEKAPKALITSKRMEHEAELVRSFFGGFTVKFWGILKMSMAERGVPMMPDVAIRRVWHAGVCRGARVPQPGALRPAHGAERCAKNHGVHARASNPCVLCRRTPSHCRSTHAHLCRPS